MLILPGINIKNDVTTKITKANKKENLINDLKAKSAKNDLKGIWQSIKLAANLPTKSKHQNLSQDKNINASSLNQHFCKIGPKLRESIPIYNGISFKDFDT